MEQDQQEDFVHSISHLNPKDSFSRAIIQALIVDEQRKCRQAMANGELFEHVKATRLRIKYLQNLLK